MKILITGGAGFIGSNSADYFLNQGHQVTIFDNMSRPGAALNLKWLKENHSDRLQVIKADIRDQQAMETAVVGKDVVLHLAGQVAVTTSVQNPREDFEINALGTFNVVEAIRTQAPDAILLNASTNKVYGGMEQLTIVAENDRYNYADYPHGIPETMPLDFHSPYGCSKGAGDQYVIDYSRIYGLRSVTLRQSCIYGPRQFGVEDQGWVAHFIISAVLGRPLYIFGDGKQVRDILHISDLVAAYDLAIQKIDQVAGQALNLGGGADNTLAIWSEFGSILEELKGASIPIEYRDWRPGDQRVFVADIRKAQQLLDWHPKTSVNEGIQHLYRWVTNNQGLF